MLRQWSSAFPAGSVVPEGVEDCVIVLPKETIWLQVKSRKSGHFTKHEAEAIVSRATKKAAMLGLQLEPRITVCFEQPVKDVDASGFAEIFGSSGDFFVSEQPAQEIATLVLETIGCSELTAEGVAADIYLLVAETAAANASRSFDERAHLTTQHIERRIQERLEASDSAAIDEAISTGTLRTLNFEAILEDDEFYRGVKAQPGHVVSGLVVARPKEVKSTIKALETHRHVLIRGPSGSGKSALLWLTANSLSSQMRWYVIAVDSNASSVKSIVAFVNARRPSATSPIALAFDEIDWVNVELWNTLAPALLAIPHVYLLGSIRQEDANLVRSLANVPFIDIALNERLAQDLWKELRERGQTDWQHWLEPFETSEGLLLEYVHLLTQGQRLSALISDQVSARIREGRDHELAIIRASSTIARFSGSVMVRPLLATLGITDSQGSAALQRLLNEHLIKEIGPGQLGGLHQLRSQALVEASHDETVFFAEESLWQALPAATSETLPYVIHAAMADGDELDALKRLANILADSDDLAFWVGVMTGLGFATLDRAADRLIAQLEQNSVDKAHWDFASIFACSDTEMSAFSELPNFRSISDAILAFREEPFQDLRARCLELLSPDASLPECKSLEEANALISCAIPVLGSDAIDLALVPKIEGDGTLDIDVLSSTLETAYLCSKECAVKIVDALGGEERLFGWFSDQKPWVTRPEIHLDGRYGRTVRANWVVCSEQYQGDAHDAVVKICDTLIALSPSSDAAASDAVWPNSEQMKFDDDAFFSKNIPRKKSFGAAQVAWNVVFRQIVRSKSQDTSLTSYADQMAGLTIRAERVFRRLTEKWLGKLSSTAYSIAQEINSINDAVNQLAYATPQSPQTSMAKSQSNDSAAPDTLGALLTGVLGNLVPRLVKQPGDNGLKGLACFANDLAHQADNHAASSIWRVHGAPPTKALLALASRLRSISAICHEWHEDASPVRIQAAVRAAKKANSGNGIRTVGRNCTQRAEKRLSARLATLKKLLAEIDQRAECVTRPLTEVDPTAFPAVEIAILIHVDSLEDGLVYIDHCLPIANEVLSRDWGYSFAPVLDEKILPSLALKPFRDKVIADFDFMERWDGSLPYPLGRSDISDTFQNGLTACTELSAIVLGRDLNLLHPEESRVFDVALDEYERCQKLLDDAADQHSDIDTFGWAADYLAKQFERVKLELQDVRDGKTPESPICLIAIDTLSDDPSDEALELAIVTVNLRQDESRLRH